MNGCRAFRGLVPVLVGALIAAALGTPSRAADDVSEARDVSSFDRIRLQGAFTTEISASEGRTQVVVSGNRDVVGRITTAVQNRTLVVGMRPGAGSFGRAPKLKITLPVLRSFATEGTGSTTIVGLSGGDIALDISGAASIVASGRAARENIMLNGTGKIDATAVDARDVTVDNNGFGAVFVRASGLLTMNVNGVGEIRYTGDPSHVESHVNGIGHIGRL